MEETAHGKVPTPHGDIVVAWERRGTEADVFVGALDGEGQRARRLGRTRRGHR